MDGSVAGTAGGFQAMTQDALTVLNDVPFSIPPYFALLGRAIVTLEGVALTGDPNYGIIMEAYPFVARKVGISNWNYFHIFCGLTNRLFLCSCLTRTAR